MKQEAKNLRDKLEKSEREFQKAKESLSQHEVSCNHNFEVSYDPLHTSAYTIPEFAHGSDFSASMYVPAETKDRWKRECGLCGLVEYTSKVNQEVTQKPKW